MSLYNPADDAHRLGAVPELEGRAAPGSGRVCPMSDLDLELLRGLLAEASLSLLRGRVAQAEEAVDDALRRVNAEIDHRRSKQRDRRRKVRPVLHT